MKRVRVFIELGEDGTYGAYMPDDNNLSFGAIGEGKTVEEAKQDFLNVIEDYRADGEVPAGIVFDFSYDVPSFLSFYSKKLSLAGLERITGVSQGQLSHYLTGRRHPSHKTVERIQNALQAFGTELSHVNFV
jgi:predicted RNase H-like HicB family nuclease|nr:MAG TPA: putative nuclease of the RNAse H fold, HicB family [Caudoviricetes sp.]